MYTYSMKKLYLRILDVLFPQGDDEKLLARTTNEHFIQKFLHAKEDTVVYLSSFKDLQIRAALHLNKFHKNTRARELLAQLLTLYLTQLPKKEYLLIPIPLSSKRERKRGYNQVTIIAEAALLQCNLPVHLTTHILQRNRDTKPQTSLHKEARLTNLAGAFSVSQKESQSLKGAHIILLDDVTTTGATLHEAKAVLLLHHPSSVTCVAIAR